MGDNERLFTIQPRLRLKISIPQGSSNPGPLDQLALNPLNYRCSTNGGLGNNESLQTWGGGGG